MCLKKSIRREAVAARSAPEQPVPSEAPSSTSDETLVQSVARRVPPVPRAECANEKQQDRKQSISVLSTSVEEQSIC